MKKTKGHSRRWRPVSLVVHYDLVVYCLSVEKPISVRKTPGFDPLDLLSKLK